MSSVLAIPVVQDLAQRIVTGNKLDQRRHLATVLASLPPVSGAKVLDFGCGTGLFAGTIKQLGFRYYGYDVDAGVVEYAKKRYRGVELFHSFEDVRRHSPFDVIVANCCFHHIADSNALEEL